MNKVVHKIVVALHAAHTRQVLPGIIQMTILLLPSSKVFNRLLLYLAHPLAGDFEFIADELECRALAGLQTETADNHPALFGAEIGEKIIY